MLLARRKLGENRRKEGGEDPRPGRSSVHQLVVRAIYDWPLVTGARTGMRMKIYFWWCVRVVCSFHSLKRKGDFSRDKSESNREPKRPIDRFLRFVLFILSLSLFYFPMISLLIRRIHFSNSRMFVPFDRDDSNTNSISRFLTLLFSFFLNTRNAIFHN